MKAVLADTGPLYAAAVPSDQFHERAREDLVRLEREGFVVMVAYPILCEAYGLLLRRSYPTAVHGWLRELTASIEFVNPTPEDYRQATRRARRYSDQPITLFDAVAATLSERLELAVWTYDHHFDVMGVRVWR